MRKPADVVSGDNDPFVCVLFFMAVTMVFNVHVSIYSNPSPSIKHILITEETVTFEGSSSTGALFRAGITSGIEQRKEKYIRIMTFPSHLWK